jgi:NTP pyrophosphatase (non-canonical NTP hydrolase)
VIDLTGNPVDVLVALAGEHHPLNPERVKFWRDYCNQPIYEPMDFETYRPLALRTAKLFPDRRDNLKHAVLGLITELGELASEAKRVFAYGKPFTEEMHQHCVEELGDVYWYLPLALHHLPLISGEEYMAIKMMPLDAEVTGIRDLSDVCILCIALLSPLAWVGRNLSREEAQQVSPEPENKAVTCLYTILRILDEHAARLLNVDPGAVRTQNIDKLRARYPDAYSDEAAEARADKLGLPHTAS